MREDKFDFEFLVRTCGEAGCPNALDAYLDALVSNVQSSTKAFIRNTIDDTTGLGIEFIQTTCEDHLARLKHPSE